MKIGTIPFIKKITKQTVTWLISYAKNLSWFASFGSREKPVLFFKKKFKIRVETCRETVLRFDLTEIFSGNRKINSKFSSTANSTNRNQTFSVFISKYIDISYLKHLKLYNAKTKQVFDSELRRSTFLEWLFAELQSNQKPFFVSGTLPHQSDIAHPKTR